VTDDEIA